jgi:hypothetical protein
VHRNSCILQSVILWLDSFVLVRSLNHRASMALQKSLHESYGTSLEERRHSPREGPRGSDVTSPGPIALAPRESRNGFLVTEGVAFRSSQRVFVPSLQAVLCRHSSPLWTSRCRRRWHAAEGADRRRVLVARRDSLLTTSSACSTDKGKLSHPRKQAVTYLTA